MSLERRVQLGPRRQAESSGPGRSRLVQALSSTERSSFIRIVSMERLQRMAAALVCAAAAQVKIWAVGLLGVVACFASRTVRWVQFPHGPPNFASRVCAVDTTEREQRSTRWAGTIGEWCIALHPCLGSTWSEFNSQFPDQRFERPCQRGLMAFATNEVHAGSSPAGRSTS